MAFSEVANVDKDCLDGLTGLMDSALVKSTYVFSGEKQQHGNEDYLTHYVPEKGQFQYFDTNIKLIPTYNEGGIHNTHIVPCCTSLSAHNTSSFLY